MAITGFALFIFVIGHLVGNLQVFLGPEAINQYGNFLQTVPELLWPARAFLLLMVGLHLAAAVTLWFQNRAARQIPYAQYDVVASSLAARTMIISGLIIAAFVAYHLLHFTAQVPGINLTGQDFRVLEDAKARHDIYRMMVVGFKQPLVSAFYILGIGLLCLHLSHGASSLFQSLGWNNRFYGKILDWLALIAAILLFVGYCSIPLAVLTGALK